MNPADWVILVIVVLMALQGYARGFLVGVAALVGFAGGAVAGSRLGPVVLAAGDHSPYAPLFSLGGALLLGSLLARVFEGFARRARSLLWFPPLRIADGVAGAVLTGCIGLGVVWISGAALLQGSSGFGLPPSIRSDLQRSVILRALNSTLPPSGSILNALARVDPLPSVNGRVAHVPAPRSAILRARGIRRAGGSVVRVLGNACGLGVEGSGWVAAPDLIVTAAHVVAGESDTTVQREGVGPALPARVLVFDPHNDIAVLQVRSLHLRSLALASGPAPGTPGAILGYPEDGPFTREPGRLGQTQYTLTQDTYGNQTVREISSLRGYVRPGNSGGPMVGAGGRVIGTVYAEVTNAPPGQPGGFAIPDAVVRLEIAKALRAHRAVSTRGCTD